MKNDHLHKLLIVYGSDTNNNNNKNTQLNTHTHTHTLHTIYIPDIKSTDTRITNESKKARTFVANYCTEVYTPRYVRLMCIWCGVLCKGFEAWTSYVFWINRSVFSFWEGQNRNHDWNLGIIYLAFGGRFGFFFSVSHFDCQIGWFRQWLKQKSPILELACHLEWLCFHQRFRLNDRPHYYYILHKRSAFKNLKNNANKQTNNAEIFLAMFQ